ncbi:MAG: protein kinase/lanthionine synthetase C family protein [Thermoactinospora sp.]|nr:protein kinase/lanthionine synthetase C family protein [Thermoactinospora sp.]
MLEQYELHCLANPLFYDAFSEERADYPTKSTPEGWLHAPTDTWMHYAPAGQSLPAQGWKIHASAGLDDAERVISTVWDYCVPRKIPFKFLRSRTVVAMLNSKAADRGSSGKLVTIYPKDDVQLKETLEELDGLLTGTPGPYILSDLRYGQGPLYVRYGGFVPKKVLGDDGRLVLAIENDQGELVPDRRGPGFAVPAWIELPAFLEPHLAARNAVTTQGLPYEVESVLAFSNGGGVYLATDKSDGRRVVLKEARPHAGLDTARRDAVARLRHEKAILERLQGLDAVPRLKDSFSLGEHEFIVMEFVDGNPLQRQIVQRFPLDQRDLADYTAWAVETAERVEQAVATIHERGVVFGDLHPNNILITRERRVVLIDYEVSSLAADDATATLANPAYAAPRGWRGLDVDRYALASMRLNLFAPQTTVMLPLDRGKVFHLAELIQEQFPVPAEFIREAVRTMAGPPPLSPARLRTAILSSETPDRTDRLFPGDPAQFQPGGGTSLAYGAAGVLLAMGEATDEQLDWLRRHTDPSVSGFYDGLHGVAYVLDELGHHQAARELAGRCEQVGHLGLDLFGGLAGIGLARMRLGLDAGDVVELAADRLGGPDDVPDISGGDHPRAGLMYGSSGVALLFLHAYERSRDPGLLELARTAIRQDLRRCVRTDDGSLQVNQGWRTLPYLDEGSVGIALVIARYLRHVSDDEFERALTDTMLVTRGRYFVQPGLFTGRAGMIAALRGLQGSGDDLDRLVSGLAWHALPFMGGLAFPGNQLLRLSMDLATGTAGILLALSGASLPFLDPSGGVTGSCPCPAK